MKLDPTPQHQWLKRLIGKWTYETDCDMGPGKPHAKMAGTESTAALGELWVLTTAKMGMPDGNFMDTRIALGFDTRTGRFVGTFIGSVMDSLWVYDGQLNDEQTVLTLDAVGPSMSDPKTTAQYQDVIELTPGKPDERLFRSRVMKDDGQWHEFMVGHYRRT